MRSDFTGRLLCAESFDANKDIEQWRCQNCKKTALIAAKACNISKYFSNYLCEDKAVKTGKIPIFQNKRRHYTGKTEGTVPAQWNLKF
jgi:hypothetical protein